MADALRMKDIFISNIPKGLDCRAATMIIKEHVGTVAQVENVWLNKAGGFGFVTLYDGSSVDIVLTLNGKIQINGSVLRLTRFQRKDFQRKSHTTATNVTSSHTVIQISSELTDCGRNSKGGGPGYNTYRAFRRDVPQADDLFKYTQPVLPRSLQQKKKHWKHFISPSSVASAELSTNKSQKYWRRKDGNKKSTGKHTPQTNPTLTKGDRRKSMLVDVEMAEKQYQQERSSDTEFATSDTNVQKTSRVQRPVVARVHVYDHSRYLYDVNVDNSNNKSSVIKEIAYKSQIPLASLLLSCKGKVIDHANPLKVEDDDNVHITVKGKGGMTEGGESSTSENLAVDRLKIENAGVNEQHNNTPSSILSKDDNNISNMDMKDLKDEGDNEGNLLEASCTVSKVLDEMFLSPSKLLFQKVLPFFSFIWSEMAYAHNKHGLEEFEFKMVGSFGEGSSIIYDNTPSDQDLMVVASTCQAYEHNTICVPEQYWQFRMEPCDINPCYVKLRVLKRGSLPSLFNNLPGIVGHDKTLKGNYLSNAIPATMNNLRQNAKIPPSMLDALPLMNILNGERTVTGPSLSHGVNGKFPIDKIDNVISILCPIWPDAAEEWVKRKRDYGWPSCEFITEHVKRGCYVVPVGCKQCERTYLDWRLSFVLVEQALVWNFNTTQLKCLLLLKQLKKFTFEEKIGDIISSYILKTVLFWVIEESPPDLWVPHQLLTAVQVCLDRLIASVKNDFCPHYFIRTGNLLVKRYNASEKQTIIQVCLFARENTQTLLCIIPPFYEEFQAQYTEELSQETLDYDNLECIKQNIRSAVPRMINKLLGKMLVRLPLSGQQSLLNAIEYCNKICCKIRNVCLEIGMQLQDAEDIASEIELIRSRLLWTNTCLCQESKSMTVPQNRSPIIDNLMETISICHLNATTGHFYVSNDLVKPLITKLKTLPHDRFHTILGSFHSEKKHASVEKCFSEWLVTIENYLSHKSIPCTLFLSDIVFLRFEIDLLPAPMQMELHPVQQKPKCINSPDMEQTVAVDPLVYACFLRFWCCMKLDQNIEMLKARDDMVWCCNLPEITNKAVAFNLLGYCHQHLEEYEDAFTAFCTAWKQRPHTDATLTYIAVLVNKTLLNEQDATCQNR